MRRPTLKKTPRANMKPLIQRAAPEEELSLAARRLAAAPTLTRSDLGSGRGLKYEWEFFVDQLLRDVASGGGGGPGGAVTYVHSQGMAAAVWNINHAMSSFPNVLLVDGTGQEMHAEVHYPDDQNVVIHHGSPYAGTAYLRS